MDAIGYKKPSHWSNSAIPAGKENHPVVNVSWDNAQKFCQWAGVRMPTEQEWEKAAGGVDGRAYPWGNEAPDTQRCNFNKQVGDTTPVGQYPKGVGPYGCLDMAGNVCEWCDNRLYAAGGYIIRGGSFANDWASVGCVACLSHQNGSFDDLGFRVASSSF